MRNFTLLAMLLATLLFTTSCGQHDWESLYGELFGLSSSSYEGLSGEISSSSEETQSNPIGSSSSRSNAAPGTVGPLMQAMWNQDAPYNDMLPVSGGPANDTYLGRIPANCENVAWAQIMKYYRYPEKGSGESGVWQTNGHYYGSMEMPSVNLEVNYDWGNMLNEYDWVRDGSQGWRLSANQQQRNAVATFIYHIYAANYGSRQSGTAFMHTKFGYDRNMRNVKRESYSDSDWEAMIKQQLDAGMPIIYTADEQRGLGHAFIIDGYDNAGKFHVNWGWGGYSDGWYSLDSLTTEQGYEFFSKHEIYIDIKPDQGGISSHGPSQIDNFNPSDRQWLE